MPNNQQQKKAFFNNKEEQVHILVGGTKGGKLVAVDSAFLKNIQSHATPPQQIPSNGDIHNNTNTSMLGVADLMDCRYKMLAEAGSKNIGATLPQLSNDKKGE